MMHPVASIPVASAAIGRGTPITELPTLIREDISANEAVKVCNLCDRILGDLGSVFMRAYSSGAYPAEMQALRRFIRETQDAVRDKQPQAFFK